MTPSIESTAHGGLAFDLGEAMLSRLARPSAARSFRQLVELSLGLIARPRWTNSPAWKSITTRPLVNASLPALRSVHGESAGAVKIQRCDRAPKSGVDSLDERRRCRRAVPAGTAAVPPTTHDPHREENGQDRQHPEAVSFDYWNGLGTGFSRALCGSVSRPTSSASKSGTRATHPCQRGTCGGLSLKDLIGPPQQRRRGHEVKGLRRMT